MPRFDGTGPLGYGPGTGWGRGPCMGWRCGMYSPYRFQMNKKEETEILKDEAEMLEQELKEIKKRLAELKGQK